MKTDHGKLLQLGRSLLAAALLAALALAPAAAAQLPDPVRFGLRAEMGDLGQLREWLDAGLPPDFLADRIGTGLMIAAWEGNIPMMELFVARGADVNKANKSGEQALLHAAWRGNLDAVKWLLAHGARIDRQPLQWTALHYAVFAGHAEVVQYLIARGADINARSTNGSSVLMMAVHEGREELARQLVDLGADRSVRNDRGDTALEWAMQRQQLALARLVAEPERFAVAASLPKTHWVEPVKSLPATATIVPQGEVDRLLVVRAHLASRGMTKAVDRLDRQIAGLRAKPILDRRPAAIFEITASRAAPREQKARLISERGER